MMKRFTQAFRLLLGRPLTGIDVDGTMLLDDPQISEFDYTKGPPFELVFRDVVRNLPPEKILHEEDLRVCVFPEIDGHPCEECGRASRWLVLELQNRGRWYHLVTMHETKLMVLGKVFAEILAHLETLSAIATAQRER